jgi:hypothetical protein
VKKCSTLHGDPGRFEWTGSKIGYRLQEKTGEIILHWKCPLFPPLLCLGIALFLLAPSFFILQAIWMDIQGPARSLWYFPVMNLILLGIGVYLLSLRRQVVFDSNARSVRFTKLSLAGVERLEVGFEDIVQARIAPDRVKIGYIVAAEKEGYPIPALRLVLGSDHTVLVERGRKTRLIDIGRKISGQIGCPVLVSD